MKGQLLKIGNSQGVILPKSMLRQAGIEKEIRIQIIGHQIIIEPEKSVPRKGWEEKIIESIEKEGSHEGDISPDINTKFDEKEWTW